MRVMVLVKASPDSEAGVMPTTAELTEMGRFNEELLAAGVMVAGEGLHPTSKAKRVQFSGRDRTVVDGPFDSSDLVAGFWIWQVPSMADAVAWAKRCPNTSGAGGELELRPIFEAEDFGDALTPELREQEERMRAQVEGR